jgi:glycosyltransferase involved in cell wall biosynthesis
MLAIACATFDFPSETFIRAHVRAIAPRATVLLCNNRDHAAGLGCPALAIPFDVKAAGDGHRIAEFLRHYRVDVMLAEYVSAGWRLLQACTIANVRLFVHVHGYDASMLLRDPVWRYRYQELFKHGVHIVAPSRFLARKLANIGCPPSQLYVSSCGVDTQRFRPIPGEPLRLLSVGRLVPKKAPHITISAFADVLQQFPHARLDIIGDGPLERRCQALIDERGLGARVRLLGTQCHQQVAVAMNNASLFLQHSITGEDGDTEGLPVSVLEAMSSGLPIVATRHAGIPEAVIDGEMGILVDEQDVNGMTRAIIDLLADHARAQAMGKAGRQRVLAHCTEFQMAKRLRTIMNLSPSWRLRNSLSRQFCSAWKDTAS